MEEYGMTDKQYEGMFKDSIASLDRIAAKATDSNILMAILEERQLLESKLGYAVPDRGLYNSVISE